MTDLETQEAIAWANKVIKAKGTSYTPASRNAAAFILASCDRIEALEAALGKLINAYTANVDTYRLGGFYTDPETEDEVIEARAALEARHD